MYNLFVYVLSEFILYFLASYIGMGYGESIFLEKEKKTTYTCFKKTFCVVIILVAALGKI